ncbi:MAG: hypothetical protein ACLRZ7_01660 [Lachnospiraceae bacterium]
MKKVTDTFNYIYKLHCLLKDEKRPQELDMELIKILSKYIVMEPNYYEVMQEAYKFYKKYDACHVLPLEECIIDASNLFEKTGQSEMFGELSNYFIRDFLLKDKQNNKIK